MSRTFLIDETLGNDNCAVLTKDLQNQSLGDYNLQNFYYTKNCSPCSLTNNDFLLNNVNLRARDGYGNVNSCTVDLDTSLKLGKLVHPKGKEQLNVRFNLAVPSLNTGGLIPNIDSRLKSPEDTSINRDCCRIGEIDYDRWIPLQQCYASQVQNPDHIVPPKNTMYTNTRDFCRDDDYLKRCGFVNNGNTWLRADRL